MLLSIVMAASVTPRVFKMLHKWAEGRGLDFTYAVDRSYVRCELWEEQLMTDVTWSTRDIFHCPSWEHELQCYESPYVLHGTVNKSNILLRGSDKTIWKGKNRFRVLGSQNLWWEKTFDVDCISNIVSSLAVYCLGQYWNGFDWFCTHYIGNLVCPANYFNWVWDLKLSKLMTVL